MNEIRNRGLKDVPCKPIHGVKGAHLRVGKIEILSDRGQERRNDPAESIIDGMGNHEHYQDKPGLSSLRSHVRFVAFLAVK